MASNQTPTTATPPSFHTLPELGFTICSKCKSSPICTAAELEFHVDKCWGPLAPSSAGQVKAEVQSIISLVSHLPHAGESNRKTRKNKLNGFLGQHPGMRVAHVPMLGDGGFRFECTECHHLYASKDTFNRHKCGNPSAGSPPRARRRCVNVRCQWVQALGARDEQFGQASTNSRLTFRVEEAAPLPKDAALSFFSNLDHSISAARAAAAPLGLPAVDRTSSNLMTHPSLGFLAAISKYSRKEMAAFRSRRVDAAPGPEQRGQHGVTSMMALVMKEGSTFLQGQTLSPVSVQLNKRAILAPSTVSLRPVSGDTAATYAKFVSQLLECACNIHGSSVSGSPSWSKERAEAMEVVASGGQVLRFDWQKRLPWYPSRPEPHPSDSDATKEIKGEARTAVFCQALVRLFTSTITGNPPQVEPLALAMAMFLVRLPSHQHADEARSRKRRRRRSSSDGDSSSGSLAADEPLTYVDAMHYPNFPSALSKLVPMACALWARMEAKGQPFPDDVFFSHVVQGMQGLVHRSDSAGTSFLSWVHTVQAKLSGFRDTERRAAVHVTWSGTGRGDCITIRSVSLALDGLRQMVSNSQVALRDAMVRCLFGEPALLQRALDVLDGAQGGFGNIRDDWGTWQPGRCLFDCESNFGLRAALDRLVPAFIESSSDARSSLFVSDGSGQLGACPGGAGEWMRLFRRVLECLATAMHLSGGQPARGTELMSLMWRDTSDASRNVHLVDGQICFATSWKKSRWMTSGCSTPVYRYLPTALSKLVVVCLGVLMPFAERMEAVVELDKGPHLMVHAQSPYLFSKNLQHWAASPLPSPPPFPWTLVPTSRIGDAIDVLSREVRRDECGERLGIAAYRHIIIGFSRRFIPESHPLVGFSDESVYPAPRARQQAGTGGNGNGNGDGLADDHDLSDHGEDEDEREDDWQADIHGLGGGCSRGGGDNDDILDMQAGHTTRVALTHYAIPMPITGGPDQDKCRYYLVSKKLHALLQLDGVDLRGEPADAGGCGSRVQELARRREAHAEEQRQQVEELRRNQEQRLLEVARSLAEPADADGRFSLLMGRRDMSLRPFQRRALESLFVEFRADTVLVAGTGSGKSEVWMLPSFVNKGGCTVVVAPLNALQDDLVLRCTRRGISAWAWRNRPSLAMPSVIVVSPETLVTGAWQSFAQVHSRDGRRFDMVVIDEAHMALEARRDWRPEMLRLGELTERLHAPLRLWMTATLPPSQQEQVFEHLGVADPHVVRQSTNRPNLRYRYIRQENAHLQEDVAIAAMVLRLGADRALRGIIYCQDIAQCNRLAGRMKHRGWLAYYTGDLDEADRLGRLAEWKAKGPVIVTTSALGAGVHFANVVSVIHLGTPDSIEYLCQALGRGGRDATMRPSDAVLISGGSTQSRRGADLSHFIAPASGCRRAGLRHYLDGEADGRCGPDDTGCDLCSPPLHSDDELLTTGAALAANPGPGPGPGPGPVRAPPVWSAETPLPTSQALLRQRVRLAVNAQEAAREDQANSRSRMHRGLLVYNETSAKYAARACLLCFAEQGWKGSIPAHAGDCPASCLEGWQTAREGMIQYRMMHGFAAYTCCFICWGMQCHCSSFSRDADNVRMAAECPRSDFFKDLVSVVFYLWGDLVRKAIRDLGGPSCGPSSGHTETPFGSHLVAAWLADLARLDETNPLKIKASNSHLVVIHVLGQLT